MVTLSPKPARIILHRIATRRNILVTIGVIGIFAFLWFFVSNILLHAHDPIVPLSEKNPRIKNEIIKLDEMNDQKPDIVLPNIQPKIPKIQRNKKQQITREQYEDQHNEVQLPQTQPGIPNTKPVVEDPVVEHFEKKMVEFLQPIEQDDTNPQSMKEQMHHEIKQVVEEARKKTQQQTVSVIIPLTSKISNSKIHTGTRTLKELHRLQCEINSDIKIEAILVSQELGEITQREKIQRQFSCKDFSIRFITSSKSDVIHLLNEGAKQASGNFLLFISENSYPLQRSNKHYISEMIQFMEDKHKLRVIGSKVLYNDGLMHSAGMDVAIGKDEVPKLYRRLLGYFENDTRTLMHEQVTCVSETGMFMKRETFNEFGFDTTFMDYTIPDFCLNLYKKGNYVAYYPFASFVMDEPSEDDTNLTHEEEEWSYEALTNFGKKKSPKKEKRGEFLFLQKWKNDLKEMILKKLKVHPDTTLVWDFGAGSCMYYPNMEIILNIGTGWFIETVNFVHPLENKVPIQIVTGRYDLCKGLPIATKESLERLLDRNFHKREIKIWISHKPPNRYPTFPYTGHIYYDKRPLYVIGRSMFETTSIPKMWVHNCNTMVDEVWVPSKFLKDVFIKSGVTKEKVIHIPEPLDIYLYNPETVQPMHLEKKANFNFLSIFKWEERKGPDFLFRAYFEEFTSNENVMLHIVTYIPNHFDSRNANEIEKEILEIAKRNNLDTKNLPKFNIITKVIPTLEMPSLYKSMDAFVLPTRGEGWGLPYMEAMAMELPTIGTNFGGQLDFMNSENSYLIDVEKMEKAEGLTETEDIDDNEQKWATPSVTHLRQLMRFVFENRMVAQGVGKKARKFIVDNYSQEKITNLVIQRIKEIEKILANRQRMKSEMDSYNPTLKRNLKEENLKQTNEDIHSIVEEEANEEFHNLLNDVGSPAG